MCPMHNQSFQNVDLFMCTLSASIEKETLLKAKQTRWLTVSAKSTNMYIVKTNNSTLNSRRIRPSSHQAPATSSQFSIVIKNWVCLLIVQSHQPTLNNISESVSGPTFIGPMSNHCLTLSTSQILMFVAQSLVCAKQEHLR